MFQQLAGEVGMAVLSSGKPSGEGTELNPWLWEFQLTPPHSVPSCRQVHLCCGSAQLPTGMV